MSLTFKLKYTDQTNHAMSAAFIRGDAPAVWLHTIDSWNVSPEGLTCLILSQNNRPADAAGLLVVFKAGNMPNLSLVQHPYTCLGGKLFIPVDAELTPLVNEAELAALLIWDYQVFHPTYGFIGFEKADRIGLVDLLQRQAPVQEAWSYAHAGHAGWMPLQQISIEPVALETLFDPVKDEVSSKSLKDLKKEEADKIPAWLKLLGPLGSAGLKGGLFVAKGLMGALSSGGGNQSFTTGSGEPGLLDRLTAWMSQKLEDLEKQRDSELKRLSDLFDKNMDEALQYAIPLDSKYFNRGTSESSGRLTKRSTNFNLDKLGGGQAVDGWNVDNYYDNLRNKYLLAAQKAIEANDHKKAAYIYAHLLADYHSAARVLKEGKHYREAAVLYKDHLKNIPDAATCLEEGGLMLEAIDLYVSIDRHEKAGDLYAVIGQQEKASHCYEHCVQQATANEDYLEVSRLTADKLQDPDRAKNALLTGWNDVKQPEACLTKYFNIVAAEKEQPLHQQVQQFYQQQELQIRGLIFLHVLDKVNQQHPSPELQNACRTISYEIVSEQVEQGNTQSLHLLKNFVPDDRLLLTDCHRFVRSGRVRERPVELVRNFELMKGRTWRIVMNWQNEILVLGTRVNGYFIARLAAHGHVEYWSWNIKVMEDTDVMWVANDKESNRIILYAPGTFLPSKTLHSNTHFNHELIVDTPSWLPETLIGMCLLKDTVVTLHTDTSGTFLSMFKPGGDFKSSVKLYSSEDQPLRLSLRALEELVYYNGHFYFPYHRSLLKIAENGHTHIEITAESHNYVYSVTVFARHGLYALLHTAKGCAMAYQDDDQLMRVQDAYFATGEKITATKFISPTIVAVISDNVVFVYEVRKDHEPTFVQKIAMQEEITTVFPAFARNQIGILGASGKITMHDIKSL